MTSLSAWNADALTMIAAQERSKLHVKIDISLHGVRLATPRGPSATLALLQQLVAMINQSVVKTADLITIAAL